VGVDCGQLEKNLVALGPVIPELHNLVRRNRGLFRELDVPLLLAIGSRESGLRNIEGAHGKGLFQIRPLHQPWMLSQYGCRADTNFIVRDHSAAEYGFVPSIEDAATFIMHNHLLPAWGWAADKHLGDDRLRFVVASYNAGIHVVLDSWRVTGSVDSSTTGSNYSQDVVDRARYITTLILRHGLYVEEGQYAGV
jgi:hypothetical protein